MPRPDGRGPRVLLALVLAAAATPFLAAPASAQCAMCRTLLLTPEGRQLAAAFRSGILLLLAAPFSIFAVVAALAVRLQRRRHAAAPPPVSASLGD